MKKLFVIALALALTLSMGACGRRKQTPTEATRDTAPITVPTTPTMTMPTSNIPDPTVDSNSTMGTDGATDGTAGTNDTRTNME